MKKEKTERLDKILASSGYGSRKDVKKLIKTGQVLINGQIVKNAGAQVLPSVDEIKVSGKVVEYKENIYYVK